MGKRFTLGADSCYIACKPRGPVRRNTTYKAFATPNEKRGFVMPKFFGLMPSRASSIWLRGMAGAIRKDVRTALYVFLTAMLHPLCVETKRVAPLIHKGTKTMSLVTQQASHAAASQPAMGTVATAQISTVLAAFNAANLASSYIERGNFAAARRKLVLALASVNQLTEG